VSLLKSPYNHCHQEANFGTPPLRFDAMSMNLGLQNICMLLEISKSIEKRSKTPSTVNTDKVCRQNSIEDFVEIE